MSNKVAFIILLPLSIFLYLYRAIVVFKNIEITNIFYHLTLIPIDVFMLMSLQIMIKYYTFKASYKLLIFIYPFFALIFYIDIMLERKIIEEIFKQPSASLDFVFHCLLFFVITIKLLKGIFKISERKIKYQSIFENTIHYSSLMIISTVKLYISVYYETYLTGFISLFLVLYLYYHNAIKQN